MARIVFHTGGATFHPVAQQAKQVASWLGDAHEYVYCDRVKAFEQLDSCDLLVLMALSWVEMDDKEWAGAKHLPMSQDHKRAFEKYVASGRPLLAHHGAAPSYNDWMRYGELLGVTWIWGTSFHPPLGEYPITILPTGHQVIEGVENFTIWDDLYLNMIITKEMPHQIHAQTQWEGKTYPMLITAEGGRVAGAGKMTYICNGHDMRTFESPALKRIWTNSVTWLLS